MENNLQNARKLINEIDTQMAILFEKRMEAVKEAALYKQANNLSITDTAREHELLLNNCSNIKDSNLLPYYRRFFEAQLNISKAYQTEITEKQAIFKSR